LGGTFGGKAKELGPRERYGERKGRLPSTVRVGEK
jgi:hypothetical protein